MGDMLIVAKQSHINGYVIYNVLIMMLTFSITVACTSLFAAPVGLINVHHRLVETFVSLVVC